ncbi:MAG: PIN domain-containing protein [Gammaproteobacteria bacterium]
MAGPHYLLDTNVLSAVVKRPRSELAGSIAAMNRGEYCTSIVVACELRYGVRKKGSQSLAAKVEQLLAPAGAAATEIAPEGPEVEGSAAVAPAGVPAAGAEPTATVSPVGPQRRSSPCGSR